MHELSLCRHLLRTLEDQARCQRFRRVRAVRLAVGELAGVDLPALTFAYRVATRGTLAEGSRLEIDTIPGAGRCPACGMEAPLARRHDPCPRCGAHGLVVTAGDELLIRELEVA